MTNQSLEITKIRKEKEKHDSVVLDTYIQDVERSQARQQLRESGLNHLINDFC